MEKLVLIGGGGHCKSVLDAVKRMGFFDEIVITDSNMPSDTIVMGCKVVGTDDELSRLFDDGFHNAFITVGSIKSTALRRKLAQKAISIGFTFPNIIDPSALISREVLLGSGIYVGKNVVLNAGCRISDHAIINTASIIEHDCDIGEFTHIAVGCVICGGCSIKNDVFIGANTTIIQNISIGSQMVIGAGEIVKSCMTKNRNMGGVSGNYNCELPTRVTLTSGATSKNTPESP